VPFKSAQATRPSRPTGLADGLELESTPTRIGESAPRHPAVRMHWFPRYRADWRGIRLHKRYYRSPMAVLSSRAPKGRPRRHLWRELHQTQSPVLSLSKQAAVNSQAA